MHTRLGIAAVLMSMCAIVAAQEIPPEGAGGARTAIGPVKTDLYQANYVQLGDRRADGLLYEPARLGPNARVALVYTFPRATFDASAPAEMAKRGYRALLVTPYTEDESPFDGVAETSKAITYMRSLPGVERVVIVGHSGGGRLMAFYANIALNGPKACQNPEMLYPCKTEQASGLAKPDGLVLLDPSPGAINPSSAVDPAYDANNRRTRTELDMYNPANGFDPNTGAAKYSAEFQKKFYAAQSERNMQIIDKAVARLKLIEQGKGRFKGDEPLLVVGTVNGGNAARLYHPDVSLQARTKQPHMLLKADGTRPEVIVNSVRPASGARDVRNVGSLSFWTINTTVKHFLANDAIRTTRDFAVTADDIVGVDWKSSLRSTPHNASGITIPTLVMAMSCYYFVTTSEIIYDRIPAQDKTYVAVEGALHGFTPCKPEYGNTVQRTFDFVDGWLAKAGRF